jgi:hypothetical protein
LQQWGPEQGNISFAPAELLHLLGRGSTTLLQYHRLGVHRQPLLPAPAAGHEEAHRHRLGSYTMCCCEGGLLACCCTSSCVCCSWWACLGCLTPPLTHCMRDPFAPLLYWNHAVAPTMHCQPVHTPAAHLLPLHAASLPTSPTHPGVCPCACPLLPHNR